MPTHLDRGLFVWHEVSSGNVESSVDFYTKLVGWKSESWEKNASYKMLTLRRDPKAGVWPLVEERNVVTPPPHWLCYIGTPDVDATVRQAVELGGKVAVPGYNIPGVGRMAHLQDPQGALFAVSARAEHVRYTEPDLGEFSWHELLTTNWQTAFDFYSKLFGWDRMAAIDMGPQGTYQIFGSGGHQLGGMFSPGGLPGGAQWIPYVLVRDARRTADSAKELGATITIGPMEVPGGDWVFTALDREGAVIGAHSRPRTAGTTGVTGATKRTGTGSATRKKKAAPKRTLKPSSKRESSRSRTSPRKRR